MSSSTVSERSFVVGNAVVSLAAVALLAWILLLRNPVADPGALAFMPAVNATFNSISAAAIVIGVMAIRSRKRDFHRAAMLTALGSSALFLVGYLVYHYVHGDTPFPRESGLRPFYLALLASHVVLSIVTFPMVLWTFLLAFRGRFADHRRWAKRTFPLWLYVSVTGVVVFLMLRSAY